MGVDSSVKITGEESLQHVFRETFKSCDLTTDGLLWISSESAPSGIISGETFKMVSFVTPIKRNYHGFSPTAICTTPSKQQNLADGSDTDGRNDRSSGGGRKGFLECTPKVLDYHDADSFLVSVDSENIFKAAYAIMYSSKEENPR